MVQDDVAMQTPPRAEPKVRIHLPPPASLRTLVPLAFDPSTVIPPFIAPTAVPDLAQLDDPIAAHGAAEPGEPRTPARKAGVLHVRERYLSGDTT
jgi:hypothetical protein